MERRDDRAVPRAPQQDRPRDRLMPWYQRSARPYLPYTGHVTRGLVRLDDGGLLGMWRLRGVPHELAAPDDRNAAARTLNTIYRNIADSNVTLSAHLVRHKVPTVAARR